jgi:hypothetical protein
VKHAVRGLLALVLVACGKLPTTSDGVAFLQIQQPVTRTLKVGDSLLLHATALDKNGNPLDVAIVWRTPDTTLSINSNGLVKALAPDSGRVQAVIGNDELVSDFITFTIQDTAAALRRP